jgi:hypothetical protein
LAPFQSLTRTSPCSSPWSLGITLAHAFRGFFPFSVFTATRSHITPVGPIPPVALRPQGFAPSRRLAPLMASRACSIPVPLMGFYPSRLFSAHGAVRPFERRVPRGFSSTLAGRGRPSRDSHTTRSASAGLGIGQVAAVYASMGFSASRLLAPGSEGCSSHPCIPSRAFPARPQADQTAGASGFFRLGRSRSLSRSASLLAVSHLVGLPGAFRLAEKPYR